MRQELFQVALVVRDYDEAIAFYTKKLGFLLLEDTILSESKRWVVVAPPGSSGCRLLLAKAATEEQKERIGDQTGGRVFLFLHTDDIRRDHLFLSSNGIQFTRDITEEAFGTVAVFKDIYGNLWDLIQPKERVSF